MLGHVILFGLALKLNLDTTTHSNLILKRPSIPPRAPVHCVPGWGLTGCDFTLAMQRRSMENSEFNLLEFELKFPGNCF